MIIKRSLLILAPLLLVSCGSLPSETGPVKLKVWGPNQEQNFLQSKAEEFKTANPNLNLEFEFAAVGEPDLKSILSLDIAGGADVFAFPDDQLQDLVTAGALSPVQQFRTDVIARNIEWSVDLAKIGDTVYAYPNTADNGVFMYYDKRHITAEQMTSLDSILAVAETKNSSIVIDPMGGWAMSMWFATSGNISWNAATREQTIDWNNAAGLNSAKGMFNAYATNRVIRDQGLMPTLLLENENDISKGVIAGVSGTWNANSFATILSGSRSFTLTKNTLARDFTINSDSAIVSGGDTSGLTVGQFVFGTNIPSGASIKTIIDATSLELSRKVAATVTGTPSIRTLTIGGPATVAGSTSGLMAGTRVNGTGILPGTRISSIVDANTMILSNPVTLTGESTLQIVGEHVGMIRMPTFTVGGGEEVQLGSMIGAKLIGVNGFTKQPAVAHQFANFLTNADTQKARAIQLGVGPSNLVAAADPLVQSIPSIKAISDQAPFGIPQAKSVSSFYWSPAGAFADAVITEARAIDATVEENLEDAIADGSVQDNQTAIATFRTTEKARLIALSHAKLQGYLDTFVEGVLAVNEG
jgi:maltose-binding protein MalE